MLRVFSNLKMITVKDHNEQLNIKNCLAGIKNIVSLKLNKCTSPEEKQTIINTALHALKDKQNPHSNNSIYLNKASIDYDFLEQFKNGDNKKYLKAICKYQKPPSSKNSVLNTNYIPPEEELKAWLEALGAEFNKVAQLNEIYLAKCNLYHHSIQLAPDNQLPPRLENLNKIKNIRYGDLHGNFRKLVDHFYRAGIINISQNDYEQLIVNPDLIISYIESNKIQINQEVINLPLTIILAGDIFADRNSHDGAKLDFLLFLSKNNIKFKIIWSNHDEIFYKYFYFAIKKHTVPPYEGMHHSLIIDENTHNNFKKFKQLISNHYDLIYYSNGIFFSHAPVPASLFDQLVTTCKISNSLTVEEIIKLLNNDFQESVKSNNKQINKFNQFIWVRKRYDDPSYPWKNNDMSMADTYPEIIKYQYSGHDKYPTTQRMSSLDNSCGRDTNHFSRTEIISIEME